MNSRKVGLVAVVAAVLGGALAALWAGSQPDRYSVTAVMAVAPASVIIDETQVIDIIGSLDRGGATATAAGIAGSGTVRDGATAQLGVEPGSLNDYEVDSVPVLTSSLFDINVSGPDAEVTAALANAVGTQLQVQFNALYNVYEIEFVTQARVPSTSGRPSLLLITVLGALVAASTATAVSWAAFGGRWRRPPTTSTDE
jgi:capsular polysaccharide biosynthesis protein